MKRKIISALLLVYILQSAFFSIPAANAGYTCKWFGYGSSDTEYASSYSACDATFEQCEAYRLALPTLSACESECWNIRRWNWCEAYEGCLHNIAKVEPNSGEEKYMRCIEACRAAEYETPPDCIGQLKACCVESEEKITVSSQPYDDDISGGIEDDSAHDDETYCPEGYVPDNGACVAVPTEPSSDYEIVVDPKDFTLSADGFATQNIKAHIRDKSGKTTDYPVWIEIITPNKINPGDLNVTTGIEGAGDTKVEAVYTAPEIKSGQKDEPEDEIKDLIYVFTEIDGKKSYKVINAVLIAQAEGFVVDITIEKTGFKTKNLQADFDKGSLSGTPFVLVGKEKHPVNNARVTIKGTLPDKEKTGINLTKTTQNGTFWFERLGEEGENNMGEIEMILEEDPTAYIAKAVRYGISLKAKAAQSQMTKAPGENFLKQLDELIILLADTEESDSQKVLDGIKMTAYAMFFTEYYSQKAYESMQNYRDYMTNIIKDTVGFVTGLWNITGGMFNSASDSSGAMGKVVVGWAGKESKNTFAAAFKGSYKMIVSMLKKGISMDTAANKHYMGYLNEFLGGLENKLTTDLANDADTAAKQIKDRFDAHLKRVYYRDISNVLEKYTFKMENMTGSLDARIKAAEELFKANTEEHNRRNAIQYEWDVDTAALTEFINVAKPFAKMYAMTHYPDPVTVSKAIDTAGHAFNALKIAASANHVYEWNALYYQDITSLYASLDVLYTGRAVIGGGAGEFSVVVADAGSLVPVARAQQSVDQTASLLSAIADTVEKQDESKLESQLAALSTARKDLLESTEEISGKINAGISYLEGEDLTEALAAEALLGGVEMEDYFMDMRLLSLAADAGAENVESFKKAVMDYSVSRAETVKLSGEVLKKVETAVQTASEKNNILNPSFMTYAIFAVAGIILLVGLIVAIVLIVRKKALIGIIVLGGALVAGIMVGAYGYDRMTKETPSEDEVISIPGFGEFDDDILMEEDSEEEVEDTKDVSADEPEEEPADKEEVDVADEPEIVAETKVEDGRIYNEVFGFSLDVGTEHRAKMTQLNTDDPFYAGAVVYCYKMSDENYEDWACGEGLMGVFMIAILDEETYREEKDSPYYDPDYDLGLNDGLHYMFSHPNGDFPEEVLPLVRSFGDIADSLRFEGN